MKTWFRKLSLYQKFAITIILVGLVPMLILATVILNGMISDYRLALQAQYTQAVEYVGNSLEEVLDTYNTISKMPYNYNNSQNEYARRDYLTFDNFRQMLYGEGYDPETLEEDRAAEMREFLKYLDGVDQYMQGVHFVAPSFNGQKLAFHYSRYSSFFKDEELFEERMDFEKIDQQSRYLTLIPTHEVGYFSGLNNQVFTVARNYFDLRGEVGNTPYVGTLFLDVDIRRITQIFQSVKFSGNEEFYVLDGDGNCFYSSDSTWIGQKLETAFENTDSQFVVESGENEYGLRVIAVMNTAIAFSQISSMQTIMYVFLGASVAALLAASVYFSRRLTQPMQAMMKEMEKVEKGDFNIELPVQSEDEIGVLSQRFNQMSVALKKYIDQVYVVQIRQKEAELTALKSQIYPHFLYNTLEIIRMTALDEGNKHVPEMIEALSEQIHYLIGPVQDMVPLEKELDIIKKYIYLLNCRITGNVQLRTEENGLQGILIPKLILQPIVENAYVHGIKPRGGKGSIYVETDAREGELVISVMDSGVGMDESVLERLNGLLESDEPGIKDEYNWQSIGLKNVHDRIRLLYGETYGVTVTSTVGIGTMVQVLMPVIYREGAEDADDLGG
ncbi:MAG: histidine kinase [Eubacteriales bacterium]|nr:histidine kinase [Eubacteriales bacterium]